ncbi:MAG: hypothetical protein NC320_06015 [Clostridium sp.]|nr:hypothetical protein [Clostridium sp.]
MENLMLSADGEVILYKVSQNIINDFDNILEQFYSWKKTNYYDEQLFVKFLKKKFGDECIKYIKNLGYVNHSNIPKEYRNTKWFNF